MADPPKTPLPIPEIPKVGFLQEFLEDDDEEEDIPLKTKVGKRASVSPFCYSVCF